MTKQKLKIVKAGGRVLDSEEDLTRLLNEFTSLPGKKILVHGGGVFINEMCDRLGVETKMVNGRRITSKENMDVVLMTCGGKLNKELVAGLNKRGNTAVGLCGGDMNIIESVKRNPNPIDFGMVGDIVNINTQWLDMFIEKDVVPVISSISISNDFELLNTNADTIASSIAVAMAKEYDVELFFYFDKKGVLENVEDENSVIPLLRLDDFLKMKRDKKIHDGMLPKLDNAFLALKDGVSKIYLGQSIGSGTCLVIN